MKAEKNESSNLFKSYKNINITIMEKLRYLSSKNKLSTQNSPKIIKIKNTACKNKFNFTHKKLNSNLNIIINTNSVFYNSKLQKNRAYSKYNTNKKTKNIDTNISVFQTYSNNHSYANLNKLGKKKTSDGVNDTSNKIKDYNELNNSNFQNNISQIIEQSNNINSCFETNNSSDNNNNKEHIDYFSLNKGINNLQKINISKNNSLNNTGTNSNGKAKIFQMDKYQNKNLFCDYKFQPSNKKNMNKNHNNYNQSNKSYNKSINTFNSSYNNISIYNSKKKSKSKSKTNLLNDSNCTTYNYKMNKNNQITKPTIKISSPNKRHFIIGNSNSKFSKSKEKIDVQITSINNLFNNKFLKEINNLQNELDKNMKLNHANSKYKKCNTLKQFFDKFIKKLNEYLNKNTFNFINTFLRKIINGYNEIVASLLSEHKNIQKQNIILNQKIEDLQKKIKESENIINELELNNLELLKEIKKEKKDRPCFIANNNFDKDSKINIFEENYITDEQNNKIFKLNEKNLDDLDALYFFDKINDKSKKTSSRKIPLIPIKENNEEHTRKKTFSKKMNNCKNINFIKIKYAFE